MSSSAVARFVYIALVLCFTSPGAGVEDATVQTQLDAIVQRVTAQIKEGKKSEGDLAPLLAEFDRLYAKHQHEKTDSVARILYMEAMVYFEVLDDNEKGLAIIRKLKSEFPDTVTAKKADAVLASVERLERTRDTRDQLGIGQMFPTFDEKGLEGESIDLVKYKGKVVLIDFWATWCGPCIAELPHVLDAYEEYHAKGFEIVGISLDNDETALRAFIKKRGMLWPQLFDGKGWDSKLATRYGVASIPATYLLDRDGRIAAKDLRGDALRTEVGKLLTGP
jgi:peroxiredoxin